MIDPVATTGATLLTGVVANHHSDRLTGRPITLHSLGVAHVAAHVGAAEISMVATRRGLVPPIRAMPRATEMMAVFGAGDLTTGCANVL